MELSPGFPYYLGSEMTYGPSHGRLPGARKESEEVSGTGEEGWGVSASDPFPALRVNASLVLSAGPDRGLDPPGL